MQHFGGDVSNNIKKLAHRMRKSLLAKGAARRLFGTFDPRGILGEEKVDAWTDYADPEVRTELAEGHEPSDGERLRHGNKLAARTQQRRNPLSGEREFLLHRGMGKDEIVALNDNDHYHTAHTSWTPHYNTALRFARDHGGFDDEVPPNDDVKSRVKSAWVPESKIALVPNQHGVGGYSEEHEVIVHPHRSQYASSDIIKPLADRGAYPRRKSEPTGTHAQRLKENIRAKTPLEAREPATVKKSLGAILKKAREGLNSLTPSQEISASEQNDSYDPEIAGKWLKLQDKQSFADQGDLKRWVEQQGGNMEHVSRQLNIESNLDDGRYRLADKQPSTPDKPVGFADPVEPEIPDDYQYDWEPDESLVLAHDHMPDHWRDHHTDLIAGLRPDTSAYDLGEESMTTELRVAKHDGGFLALIKPPLSQNHYGSISPRAVREKDHAHYLDPNFTSSHREAVFHRLASNIFGLGEFVPRTSLFLHPKSGDPYSAQEMLSDVRPFGGVLSSLRYKDPLPDSDDIAGQLRAQKAAGLMLEERNGRSNLQKLALMDIILGNHDRHTGNVLLTSDNKIRMIDHGLTMDYSQDSEGRSLGNHQTPSYIAHGLDSGVDPETHAWIDSLNPGKMKEELGAMRVPANLAAAAINRLIELKGWSAKERKAHRSGSQQHQGKLRNALDHLRLHTLDRQGNLRHRSEIDQARTPFANRTAPIGSDGRISHEKPKRKGDL